VCVEGETNDSESVVGSEAFSLGVFWFIEHPLKFFLIILKQNLVDIMSQPVRFVEFKKPHD
jgi:hypothetical protein